ncbi:unnamed protein product, partial [Mesorhabditis belari]|uniref:ubiquitinyl hydrolase 1 n=1 Tax=Mesorhabditis belari TaxID=2138241 RepID=A0AAF3F1K1_9BILA
MGRKNVQKGRAEALEKAKELPDVITFEHVWNMYNLTRITCGLHNYPNPKASNCRDNPYCLKRIGLEKFEKLIKSCETDQKKIEKIVEPRNVETQPCGLTNSGNFCYVNSFLQIWFNDPVFRQIIYDWRPSIEFISANPKCDVQDIMNHLQKLFYYLAFSPFESCDVQDFVNILRLDNQQQDSHEFSLLFFNMLDRHLRTHPNGETIRKQFMCRLQGSITQEIKCTCGRGSRKTDESLSLDLSIINAKTLSGCIKNYFATESLDDYQCDECGQRGNVQKSLEFTRLPQVLLLQLKRHVFDEKGQFKKSKTAVQYPRKLNGSVLNKAFGDIEYDLCAVLIHEGDETKCGHYYDIILRNEDKKWYQYNDTVVKESKAPGSANENSHPSSSKSSPDQRTWYGLVYRQHLNEPTQFRPPPEHLTKPWRASIDERFESESGKTISATLAGVDEVRKRQDVLSVLMDELELCPHKENEYTAHPEVISFLPVSLLSDIIANEFERVQSKKNFLENQGKDVDVKDPDVEMYAVSTAVQSTSRPRLRKRQAFQVEERGKNFIERELIAKKLKDHEMLLCSHKKIHIDQISSGDVKAVNAAAMDKLLNRYGFSLNYEVDVLRKDKFGTLRGSELCLDCVQDLRLEAISMDSLERDEKLAVRVLKEEKTRCSTRVNNPTNGDYYIAKKALQAYKRLLTREQEYRRHQREICSRLIFSTSKPYTHKGGTSSAGSSQKQESDIDSVASTNKRIRMDLITEKDEAIKRENDEGLTNGTSLMKITEEQDEEILRDVGNILLDIIDDVSQKEKCQLTNGDESSHSDDESGPSKNGKLDDEDFGSAEFNAELRCVHGNLNAHEFRFAVSPDEWRQLNENFRRFYEVPVEVPVCSNCEFDEQLKKYGDEENNHRVQELTRKIHPLLKSYEMRKDIKVSDMGKKYKYLVCNRFFENLNKAARAVRSRRPAVSMCQDCLLCVDHGRPFITINPDELKEMAYPIPVTEEEWTSIRDMMGRGDQCQPIAYQLHDGGSIESFCDECHDKFLQAYNEKQYLYDNGTLYVKMQMDLSDESETAASQKVAAPSTRRNALKNLLKVKMSSKETVHELKVKLYRLTQHSPVDQLLYQALGGVLLEDEMTLETARVLPNNQDNPLVLHVQARSANPLPTDEIRTPERGFADTALAH